MDLLLIDDEASLRRTLRTALESMGHSVVESASGEQAPPLAAQTALRRRLSGSETAARGRYRSVAALLRESPRLAVIVITAHATIASAVEAMRRGLRLSAQAVHSRSAASRPRTLAANAALRNQVTTLEEQVRSATPEMDLQTQEPAMQQALDLAFHVASSEATVLLRGESGTGKGVLRARHP